MDNKRTKNNKQISNENINTNIITENCPKCAGKMAISQINIDNPMNSIAIKIKCLKCDFEYPPLIFPKFSEITHLLWKELYKILTNFDMKPLFF